MLGRREWSATTAGTDSGATTIKAAEAGVVHIITHLSGHVDEDAHVRILDGSTTMAEFKIDFSSEGKQFNSWEGHIVGTRGNTVGAQISNSDTACQININGYSSP